MNAVVRHDGVLVPMAVGELSLVTAIEAAAYDFPWTRGNFIDSIAAGYLARQLRSPMGQLIGYFIAMKGVDEMHLLNLTVAPAEQGRGHGRRMLDDLAALCREHHAERLWLEVRESNARARALYLRYGFRHIGTRRGYYPALHGQREDAAVMSLDIAGERHALD
jgi:ribosomal-protein-alanine N-acetyltransferase